MFNSLFASIIAAFSFSGDAPAVKADFGCNPTWSYNTLYKYGKCDLSNVGRGNEKSPAKGPKVHRASPSPDPDPVPGDDDDGNNGHGNDDDHDDDSNPGHGKGNHGTK
jgi:hypothetical protein